MKLQLAVAALLGFTSAIRVHTHEMTEEQVGTAVELAEMLTMQNLQKILAQNKALNMCQGEACEDEDSGWEPEEEPWEPPKDHSMGPPPS